MVTPKVGDLVPEPVPGPLPAPPGTTALATAAMNTAATTAALIVTSAGPVKLGARRRRMLLLLLLGAGNPQVRGPLGLKHPARRRVWLPRQHQLSPQ